MIQNLKYHPAAGRSKAFWGFDYVLKNAVGLEMVIHFWRYWPDSRDVKPPIIFKGQQQIWPVKVEGAWLERIKDDVERAIAGDVYSVVSDVEEKRNFSNEDLDEVRQDILNGDADKLNRFCNLTEERARELGIPVPTQADKDYLLKRLKEVLDGTD